MLEGTQDLPSIKIYRRRTDRTPRAEENTRIKNKTLNADVLSHPLLRALQQASKKHNSTQKSTATKSDRPNLSIPLPIVHISYYTAELFVLSVC